MQTVKKMQNSLNSMRPIRISKGWINAGRALIHIISIAWLSVVYLDALSGELPGDPVQYLLDFSGIGTLHLLIMSLLISPMAQTFKFGQLVRLRKTLGVYAAVYALFHLYVFIAYELQYEWLLIAEEIIKRPYITVGMLALSILSVLLITSLQAIKARMGTAWQKLHNWVYLATILGCIHFLWSVKSNWYEPTAYLITALILISLRRKKLQKIFK
ncbi:sulfite oxidase heme-binding subunit YedZ [Glaciecola siphonariae]|uniref:Protein-methionine-sulfoxide reductase heme-binding subunit MsrQ n=1 Tax=Glaciecola siphonariae TaxID=521012 RepID=A0ABV9LTG0_9ALTE